MTLRRLAKNEIRESELFAKKLAQFKFELLQENIKRIKKLISCEKDFLEDGKLTLIIDDLERKSSLLLDVVINKKIFTCDDIPF